MARYVLALTFCVGVLTVSAQASGPQAVDTLIRQYDAAAVADGRIQVSTAGNLAYVTGTSEDGPWMEVWRLKAGRWMMVAEAGRSEMAPIRFGIKRERSCRRTS
jgi:hypothetical protein